MIALTENEYKEIHGACCPVCFCPDLEGASWESDGEIVWQTITCGNCGAIWSDVYLLHTYNDLEITEDKIKKVREKQLADILGLFEIESKIPISDAAVQVAQLLDIPKVGVKFLLDILVSENKLIVFLNDEGEETWYGLPPRRAGRRIKVLKK